MRAANAVLLQQKTPSFFYLLIFFFTATAIFLSNTPLHAQNEDTNQKSTETQDIPNPPPGLENKTPLSEKDINTKQEGLYFTGLPLINSDPDTGIGYGIRVYMNNNGPKKSPYFYYTPYRFQSYAQFFQTTGGWSYHEINFDAPYFLNTKIRVRSSLVLERDISKNFFGIKSEQYSKLVDRYGKSYSNIDDYLKERRQIYTDPDDGLQYTDARYHKYDIQQPAWELTGEYDLAGGLVRLMAGFKLRYVKIRDYSYRDQDYKDNNIKGLEGDSEVNATNGQTLLNELYLAGEIEGYNGGWDNFYKFGIAFDTRDFEPDPKNGIFTDLTFEATGDYNGSEYSYVRSTLAPRFYYSPIPSYQNLTIAGRWVYSTLSGSSIPFYTYNNISFTDSDKSGLGGYRTLRGYVDSRFTGKVITVATLELRERFYLLSIWGQTFEFILAPFIDYGKAFDSVEDSNFNNWKAGYGAGLRIAWNQATIIMIDYGISEEGSGLYINFKHIF